MNNEVIFQFLRGVTCHNNREWFAENRALYEAAKAQFDRLLTAVIAGIASYDESVKGLEPKDCTYRIYRDTRFSTDKTPYKTHIGGYINAKGKKSDHCGYYLHIEPEGCMLAGGSYCLPPPVMKALRQAVYDNIDEYREIVEDPIFKQHFPQVGETFLKTAPKGFPRDFEHLRYLQCKEFTVACMLPDDFFLQADCAERSARIFKIMKPFCDFLNFTIDEEEGL